MASSQDSLRTDIDTSEAIEVCFNEICELNRNTICMRMYRDSCDPAWV